MSMLHGVHVLGADAKVVPLSPDEKKDIFDPGWRQRDARPKSVGQNQGAAVALLVSALIGGVAGGVIGAVLFPAHRIIGFAAGSMFLGIPVGLIGGTIIASRSLK